jgi:hypothetical protein
MRALAGRIATLAAVLLLAGCGGFKPLPLEQTDLLERAQTQTREPFTVTVAVPTAEEARLLFDGKLHKKGIQPVWIAVENGGDDPAWFFPYGVDADYFPALEVAWRTHRTWAKKTNRRIDEFYYDEQVPLQIPAEDGVSGWVFVNLDRGHKYVPVKLFGENDLWDFEFFVKDPALKTDYSRVDFQTLYEPDEIVEIDDEEELRRWAEQVPCCTENAKKTRQGDPINFILVASDAAMVSALKRARWDETAALTFGTSSKTAASAVFGKTYRYAPMSSLYALGRPQDIGLQKARKSIHQRNHLRLWLAPLIFRGDYVWLGQISRDIGSRITTKSPTLTTHKIDPDLDDARDVLILDLVFMQSLAAYGYVKGVGAATPDEPRGNLTGDPYFTDGLRAVLFLSEERVPLERLRYIEWEEPVDPER